MNLIGVQGPRGVVMLGNTPAGLTLPMGQNGAQFSGRNGLQLSVKTEWPGQYGYRPINVTVRSEKPATSDRAVEFRFSAGDWNFGSNGVNARQRFVLAQGATEVKMQLLVPQNYSWQLCSWELYVDGARDEEFAVKAVDMNNLSPNSTNNPADIAAVGVSLNLAQQIAAAADLGLAYSNTSATLEGMQAADLPTDWLAYTSLNLVVMSADKFNELVAKQPQRATALLR